MSIPLRAIREAGRCARCVPLGDNLRCSIFGKPERFACCSGLQLQLDRVGTKCVDAFKWLTQLERDALPVTTASVSPMRGRQHTSPASVV